MSAVSEKLKELFLSQGIEFFSVLSYSDCTESSPSIIQRSSVTPRSVIIYLLPYYAGETVNLSRYAASLDYHIVISEINKAIINGLSEMFPGSASVGYGDHSPIDERKAALISGLGIAGKNGLIINEKYGSYVFIADVITDVPPDLLDAVAPSEICGCNGCGACFRACPTGILSGNGEVCLSALTQKKGELTPEEQQMIIDGNSVWGCDACQTACPYNANPIITPIEAFKKDRIPHLTRNILDSMDKAAFNRRAFAWRGRKTVERNVDLFENREKKTAE